MNCLGCDDCLSTTRVHAQGSRVFSGSPMPGADDPTSEGAAQPERTRRTSVSRRELVAEIAAERRAEFADSDTRTREAVLLDDVTEIARRAGIEPPPGQARDETLALADEIMHGDRQDDYGDPMVELERIGTMWGVLLDLPTPVEPRKVAWMMVALKACRDTSPGGKPKHDNAVDAAAYAAFAGRVRYES